MQPTNPFTWPSGLKSPIYCDNRITLSHPTIRTYIRQRLTELIQEEYGSVSLIAGIATAGIPQGTLVAQELGLPFCYVRSAPKEHGKKNLIEGDGFEGKRVVVVEDLISTGKSSLSAIKALKDAKGDVAGLVSIFDYELKEAEDNFKKAKCRYSSLLNYTSLIRYAYKNNLITNDELKLLENWHQQPAT